VNHSSLYWTTVFLGSLGPGGRTRRGFDQNEQVARVIQTERTEGHRPTPGADEGETNSDLFLSGPTLLPSSCGLAACLQFRREAGATERVRPHQEASRDVPHEVCGWRGVR